LGVEEPTVPAVPVVEDAEYQKINVDELMGEIERVVDTKEPEPAPLHTEGGSEGEWKIAKVDNIEQVYKYLTEVPEEVADLGEQADLTDKILTYLREA
jgi:hypothetical protein